MKILNREYIAQVLIDSKKQVLNEGFITLTELNKFVIFLQREFTERNLDIVIISNILDSEKFTIFSGVIMNKENCFNLDFISSEILDILCDDSLITRFLLELEEEKIEKIKQKKFKVKQL